MRDWNGNKASVRANLGIVQKGNIADRQSEDFYATEPVIRWLQTDNKNNILQK